MELQEGREQRNIKIADDLPDLMDSTISMEEQKKSPGPDGITNEMLINAGKPALYNIYIFSTKHGKKAPSHSHGEKQ